MNKRSRYVDEEYREKVEEYASSNGLTEAEAFENFIGHCEEMEGFLKSETPAETIRRIAFNKLKSE